MATGIKFDMATFNRGLRAKLKVTKVACEEIINRAGGSALANAIRLTKGAKKSDVTGPLIRDGLALKLVQSKRFAHRLPKLLQGFPGGRHIKAEIDAAAAKLVALRNASRRYIAAGWFKAFAVFRPNSARKVSDKGLAGLGRAKKATVSSLKATFENYSTGAEKMGVAPLQQALDREGESMQSYAAKKLAQAWK